MPSGSSRPVEHWGQGAGRWVLPKKWRVGCPKEMGGTGMALRNMVKQGMAEEEILRAAGVV